MGDGLETVPMVRVTGEKAGFVLYVNSLCRQAGSSGKVP